LGWLSDILPRKHVLMISLVGSAVAYGMVGAAAFHRSQCAVVLRLTHQYPLLVEQVGVVRSFYGLVLSRILVGLVKQVSCIAFGHKHPCPRGD
jgi:MFS family permease